MFTIRSVIASGALALSLVVGVQVDQARAESGSSDAKDAAGGLSPEQFDKLRTLIKPLPGGFDDLAWMTDLHEARTKAAAEGKPLLVWVGDGHPLGWT